MLEIDPGKDAAGFTEGVALGLTFQLLHAIFIDRLWESLLGRVRQARET